jgi:hypothetical protein
MGRRARTGAMTMGNTIMIRVAATAALALGCGGSLSHDAGTQGQGGGTIMTGGAGASGTVDGGASGAAGNGASGAAGNGESGGGGGASQVVDAGADQLSCVAVCGAVTGVLSEGVTSCRYPLRCASPPGFTGLIVFVNGQPVSQDPTLTEGWSYGDATMSAFQLYGQACVDARATGGFVDFDYLCEVALPAP